MEIDEKLVEIDPHLLLNLEEEVMDSYNTTLARLRFAEMEIKWPLKQVYAPVKEQLKKNKRHFDVF